MSVALVRRRECVPKRRGSRPIVATQLETSRAEHIAGSSCSGCDDHDHRTEIRPFLASDFDVIVNSLPRLLRQLKPNGPTGLLLPHCGAIDRKPAGCKVLDLKCDDIAAPQLAVDLARVNIAKSRVRPSVCNRVRIDQTCFGRSGGFWPMSFPLFQGSRRGVEDIVCASVSMVILLGW
jgi:hypothetical protein